MPPPSGVADRRKTSLSLRGTFLAVAAAIGVPLLLLLGYLAWGEVERDRFRIQQEALDQARTLGTQIEQHLSTRLDRLAAAGAAIGGSGPSPAVIDAQARRLREAFPDIERLLFVDELGLVLAAVPSGGEIRRSGIAEQAWFKEVVTATEPRVGEAFQQGPRILVSLAAPARAPEGQLRGAIAAEVSLGPIQDLLAGAGLDMRSITHTADRPEITFFEIDLPEMIAERQRVLQLFPDSGAAHRVMIAADFRKDDLQSLLEQDERFDASLPTVIIYEGCSMYFSDEENRQIFEAFRGLMRHPDSRVRRPSPRRGTGRRPPARRWPCARP